MKYPAMGSNPRNAVSIPALSGGVNFADALNLVDDNQITDCKNVWYKDGVLQTRPGIKSEFIADISAEKSIHEVGGMYDWSGNKCKIFVVEGIPENGKTEYTLYGVPENFQGTDEFGTYLYSIKLGENLKSWVFYNGKPTKGSGLYVMITTSNDKVELYEFSADGNLTKLQSEELYAPIVYINGKGSNYEDKVSQEATYAPASFFEGFNSIDDAWARYYYTTDDESLFYMLPHSIDNSFLKVELTDLNGIIYTGSFKIVNGKLEGNTSAVIGENGQIVAAGAGADGKDLTLFFWVNTKLNSIHALNENKGAAGWPNAIGAITNNLKIMLKPIDTQQKSIVAGATQSNEFGGVAEGIYGGSRTFLSGFSGEHKNLVVWSDLNNPTYFSENNYVYVGLNTQSVTALAKQDDMLVIFKEKEMFYAKYIQGEGYTAEDVLAGRVIDVTTLSAKFPITQINDKIGCDLPNSIQLCGDRLVWADSGNHVYMLRSANQYSTANVSVISHMLGDKLKLSVTDATATTYDGFYILKSGNKMYLMNYDQYFFNALPSYSDTKKANRKMQWFIWELPKLDDDAFFFKPNSLSLIVSQRDPMIGQSVYLWSFTSQNGKDYNPIFWEDNPNQERLIESVIQTKMFDFNAMDRFKSIEQMYVGFGEVEGETSVQYLTDRGTLDKGVVVIDSNGDLQSPQFIKTKRFLPGIKRALRFGVRFTATGKIAISGILIKFKYTGVTR